jgi:hypothetical protein
LNENAPLLEIVDKKIQHLPGTIAKRRHIQASHSTISTFQGSGSFLTVSGCDRGVDVCRVVATVRSLTHS